MELLIMAAMFGVLWLLILRPQQQRAKAQRLLLSELSEGDEVLTASGIYGQITEFDGLAVFIAVADNLEIKITRDSIAERVVYADPDDSTAETSDQSVSVQDDVEDN